MSIPDSVSHLAGFALGHALWNVCDFEEEDEVMSPFAFTFDGQHKQLLRFEADSQEEATEQGRATLAGDASLSEWAFVREGLFPTEDGMIDVLLVEAWNREITEPVVFAQPFQPAISGEFCLLGAPAVFVDGVACADADVLDQLKAGVLSHQKAAELWSNWEGW